MARRRLVSYQELRRLLQARYIDGNCTIEERYIVEMMRFDDGHFDLECLLMMAGKKRRANDGGLPD